MFVKTVGIEGDGNFSRPRVHALAHVHTLAHTHTHTHPHTYPANMHQHTHSFVVAKHKKTTLWTEKVIL